MSTENKEFDSGKINSYIQDEAGHIPLVFKMNGCKFRWDVFKMAYEMSHPKSFDRIVKTANDIIDFVNNEQKIFPKK